MAQYTLPHLPYHYRALAPTWQASWRNVVTRADAQQTVRA
jgi:hypothetical protein